MNLKNEKLKIRLATKSDAKSILKIYAPYVEKTAITFEYDVPSLQEFEKRIEKTFKNCNIKLHYFLNFFSTPVD